MQNDALLALIRAAIAEDPRRLILCVLPPLYAPLDERYIAHQLKSRNINLHNEVWDHLQPKGYDFFFFKQPIFNPEVRQGIFEAIRKVGESFTAEKLQVVTNIRFLYTCRDEGNRVIDLPTLLRPFVERGPCVITVPGIIVEGKLIFIDVVQPFTIDGCLLLGSDQGPIRGSVPEAWLQAPEAPRADPAGPPSPEGAP